jgi:hypothetical protein
MWIEILRSSEMWRHVLFHNYKCFLETCCLCLHCRRALPYFVYRLKIEPKTSCTWSNSANWSTVTFGSNDLETHMSFHLTRTILNTNFMAFPNLLHTLYILSLALETCARLATHCTFVLGETTIHRRDNNWVLEWDTFFQRIIGK